LVKTRPWQEPDDLPGIAEIFNAAAWEPVTPEALAQRGQAQPGICRQQLVSVNAVGDVNGFGWVEHQGFESPGDFKIKVQVHPDSRRQGVGSALLQELEAYGREHGATQFEAKILDTQPGWLAFAEKHGYVPQCHHLAFRLDLESFDETRFADERWRLAAKGVRLLSMAEPHSPELERSLYDLIIEAGHDEPGYESAQFPPFAEWRAEAFADPDRPPEYIWVAGEGDRALGMHSMSLLRRTGNVQADFSGVRRDQRGRGITLALKVAALSLAKSHGAGAALTGSDARNAAMIAVNRKLGYAPLTGKGMYRCFKEA
jgi:GNAT superfamily N-acetyltransferase